MSSDPFELLGLDRKTASDADVRRAYAERLKQTRPEDDRAGFMALRAAFERARESVRWRDQYGDDEDYDDYDDEDEVEDSVAVEAASALAPAEPVVDAPATDDLADDDSRLSVPEVPEPEPERDPLDDAMTALIGALTDSPFGASVDKVMAIIEADEISGIDDFQAMQWRARTFLCDRTGYNLEPQAIRLPEWLTGKVFDALDTYYGWTRQPVTESWIRAQNDWLARVRREIGLAELPKDERKKAELNKALQELGHARPETRPNNSGGNGLGWLGLAGGVIGYAIFQFVMKVSGG